MFNSIIDTSITPLTMLVCILTSLICGLIISLSYKKTGPTSQNFLITLIMLPALVCMVIMLVNGNLGASVAIVGAFNLVRFRSIPGSSKDILGVFFVMAVGLATGMGYVFFATVITLLLSLVMIVLYSTHFGLAHSNHRHLRVTIPEDLAYNEAFDDIFNTYTKTARLTKTKTTNLGSLFELTYDIQLKDIKSEKEMIDKIRIRNGNLPIILSETKPIEESL